MNAHAVPSTFGTGGTALTMVRLDLPHGLPAAAARRAATAALTDWGLLERGDDVLLVTTELVQNVTQHTGNGGELRLARLDDGILIEVADASPQQPAVRAHDPRALGGRGLQIIEAVTHRWGSRPLTWSGRQGKVVWAVLPA